MKNSKKDVDLSVIIPVWETPAGYVKKCVESLKDRNSEEIEVILVDDGNTGELPEELDRLAVGFPNLRILHTMHAGVSAARNEGLLEASGKYVTFLDADDELNTDVLDEAIEILLQRKPDLLISRITRGNLNTGKLNTANMNGRKIDAEGDSAAFLEDSAELRRNLRVYYTTLRDSCFRDADSWINRAPHGRFLTRELAMECRMQEELSFGEDVIWNFELLNHARSLLVTDLQTYCYNKQAFSATQKGREDFPQELKRLLRYYRKEIRKWPENDRKYYDTAAVEYFTILMRLYVFADYAENSRDRFKQSFRDLMWKRIFSRLQLDTLSGRYKLTGLLGKFRCERLLYLVMWIYDRSVRRRQIHD